MENESIYIGTNCFPYLINIFEEPTKLSILQIDPFSKNSVEFSAGRVGLLILKLTIAMGPSLEDSLRVF